MGIIDNVLACLGDSRDEFASDLSFVDEAQGMDRLERMVSTGRKWFIRAVNSDDPIQWKHALSCIDCLRAVGFIYMDRKQSFESLAVEAGAQAWDREGTWDAVERARENVLTGVTS